MRLIANQNNDKCDFLPDLPHGIAIIEQRSDSFTTAQTQGTSLRRCYEIDDQLACPSSPFSLRARDSKMSAILSANDLNDFISPGVACIKPVETLPLQDPQKSEVRWDSAFSLYYADALIECLRSHHRGQGRTREPPTSANLPDRLPCLFGMCHLS